MFPYPVTPWASAEPPHSCGSHGSPAQPLPDLLCSCPPPQAHAAPETPSPDPPGSIIVVTQYESSRSPAGPEDEEVGGLRTMARRSPVKQLLLLLSAVSPAPGGGVHWDRC